MPPPTASPHPAPDRSRHVARPDDDRFRITRQAPLRAVAGAAKLARYRGATAVPTAFTSN